MNQVTVEQMIEFLSYFDKKDTIQFVENLDDHDNPTCILHINGLDLYSIDNIEYPAIYVSK